MPPRLPMNSASDGEPVVAASPSFSRARRLADVCTTKVTRLTEKLTKLKEEVGKLAVYEKQMLASPDQQISLTDPDSRSMATSCFMR